MPYARHVSPIALLMSRHLSQILRRTLTADDLGPLRDDFTGIQQQQRHLRAFFEPRHRCRHRCLPPAPSYRDVPDANAPPRQGLCPGDAWPPPGFPFWLAAEIHEDDSSPGPAAEGQVPQDTRQLTLFSWMTALLLTPGFQLPKRVRPQRRLSTAENAVAVSPNACGHRTLQLDGRSGRSERCNGVHYNLS